MKGDLLKEFIDDINANGGIEKVRGCVMSVNMENKTLNLSDGEPVEIITAIANIIMGLSNAYGIKTDRLLEMITYTIDVGKDKVTYQQREI